VRHAKDIKAWLVRRGVTQTDIARQINVSVSLVAHTINGRINNRRVLKELVRMGVPERYLALPEDLQTEEAA